MAFDTKATLSCISFYWSDFNQSGFMGPSSTIDIWHSNICPGDFCPGDNYKNWKGVPCNYFISYVFIFSIFSIKYKNSIFKSRIY